MYHFILPDKQGRKRSTGIQRNKLGNPGKFAVRINKLLNLVMTALDRLQGLWVKCERISDKWEKCGCAVSFKGKCFSIDYLTALHLKKSSLS